MRTIKIKKGLDLPYHFKGDSTSFYNFTPQKVSISGYDYPFKPNLVVEEGTIVRRGEFLFTTKDDHNIGVVSPVNGQVSGIHRGDRRALISVSIDVDTSSHDSESYRNISQSSTFPNLNASNRSQIIETLASNGAWVYLRTRPFSLVPKLGDEPQSIFVNGMDSEPGAVSIKSLLKARGKYLQKGFEVMSCLTQGKLYFCQNAKEDWSDELDIISLKKKIGENKIEQVAFAGRHPSGLTSTHIHFLSPASLKNQVWTIPANLLADLGEFWATGVLPNKIRFSLSGPYWKNPQMMETTIGSHITKMIEPNLPQHSDRLNSQDRFRIVSGSILHGWEAKGAWDFIGRFHNQISILKNNIPRDFLDWILPGFKKHSITRTVLGRWFPKNIDWTTSQHGSPRAIVPIGNYERVMPMDILPTQLLRALVTQDWEEAIELGALELDEKDMSLLTYVCPGKKDYGKMLKDVLKQARKELV